MRVLLFLALLFPGLAAAQVPPPPCWPSPLGDGSAAQIRANGNGMAVAWACGQRKYGFAGRWTLDFDPGYQQQIPDLIAGGPEAWADMWRKRVTRSANDPALNVVRPLLASALSAVELQPVAPAEVWTVATLGTSSTRPTRIWPYEYTVAGAIRSAAERVDVGAPCDPAVGDQTSNWRGVLGRPDRVALCVKQ